jgi:hypothetical protein
MRHVARERQASCQTEQCLLDALKPATAEALVQTNPVPQLALGLALGAGLEGTTGVPREAAGLAAGVPRHSPSRAACTQYCGHSRQARFALLMRCPGPMGWSAGALAQTLP